jgi:hypothetical protein
MSIPSHQLSFNLIIFSFTNQQIPPTMATLPYEIRRTNMKFFTHMSSIAFVMSLFACGRVSQPISNSALREAPDALNAYQRIGLTTKPYTDIRANAQVNDPAKYWSGFYWSTYQGGIAQRWQASIDSTYFTDYLYVIENVQDYWQLLPEQVTMLSPAEKYDLWVNDASMRLTRSEQQKVLATAYNFGNTIPTWFGICDGWALATQMEDEPVRMVRAQSSSGQLIDFYPEDIKALMAYYYALAPKRYVTAGGRCNRPTVTKDANGRVVEPECRDINPATLHLALDRFVGDANQKLVVDIARDEMVWNYPIYAYDFQYSNLRRLTDDPAYQHAAAGTQSLINVRAHLVLVSGTDPTTQLAQQRSYTQKTWNYILELDANSRVIGGEWLSDDHPDFIWIVRSVQDGSSLIDYRNLSTLTQASHAL